MWCLPSVLTSSLLSFDAWSLAVFFHIHPKQLLWFHSSVPVNEVQDFKVIPDVLLQNMCTCSRSYHENWLVLFLSLNWNFHMNNFWFVPQSAPGTFLLLKPPVMCCNNTVYNQFDFCVLNLKMSMYIDAISVVWSLCYQWIISHSYFISAS